jgi:ketosteroid isomerase-like protein
MGVLTFSDLRFFLLSENAAWVLGIWKLKRDSDEPKGIFTLIFRKIEGEWKIIHDHTSSEE